VLIGTIGRSTLIDGLIRAGKLEVKSIAGKWESFVLATVADPLPGVRMGLVIAGSDRRGTAYGVFDLSEAIGVSPWVWWADVAPRHRDPLTLGTGTHTQGSPSVKYRGIFINDEDWGLQPWAAKTFEPETADIGPKTYAKVCELLLRLKANYLWPAMHPSTKAFNFFPSNKVVADDYAIVLGSSHAEPMLRNNVGEWDPAKNGEWDYDKNRDGILKYWEERVQENGRYENVYTIGMRGIHDGAMPGGGTTEDKVARLQRVLADEREILARKVNPKVEQVPQIFVPYKEVLALYQKGLQVPEDVTLVWPDDNHGYIRQLSTPQEQKRSGGAGVYYHVSYWGAPEDYLWLCTTPPALVWEEMRKAYDCGARTVWVVNVGDIKPAEIDLEFFLRMAWNIESWNESAQPVFLADWALRNFGKERAAEIAAALGEYYGLNYAAKPEHLLKAQFSNSYREKEQRLQRFGRLVEKTNALYEKMPKESRDAFYELVAYPIRCSALMNEKYLSASPEQALRAHDQIQSETAYYNEQLAGGKWKNILSANPRKQPVFRKPAPGGKTEPGIVATSQEIVAESGCIAIEAEHPTRATNGNGAVWKTIAGLGRSGDAIALLPTTVSEPGGAELNYDFTASKAGVATVLVYCIPTHAIHPGVRLRYSVTIDGQTPKTVDLDTAEFSAAWGVNVLRAAAIGTTEHPLPDIGKHTLKVRPLDPGVIFDKIVIDFGGLKPSHLGPPETASPAHD
jgi:Glycosyl hydrolase family 115/Gylcosyl hydrolase family 115 C-terminal domain